MLQRPRLRRSVGMVLGALLLILGALALAFPTEFSTLLRGSIGDSEDPFPIRDRDHPFPPGSGSGSGGTSVIEIPPKCEDFQAASTALTPGATVRFSWKVSATDKVRITGPNGFDSGLLNGHLDQTTPAGHGLGHLDIMLPQSGTASYKLIPYWYQNDTTPGYTCIETVTIASGSGSQPACTALTSSAQTVAPGTPVTLTWTTTGSDHVTLRRNIGTGESQVVQANLPANGTLQVTPESPATLYRIVPFKGSPGFGRSSCVYEQIGEQPGPILDVRDIGSERASFWSTQPLNPGEGFNCLKTEFEMETPDNLQQMIEAYQGVGCPIYTAIGALSGKPGSRKLLSGGLFHYLQVGCTRGADRLEMNNSWTDNSGTSGPWAPGQKWKVVLEAKPFSSSVALYKDGNQVGPTIASDLRNASGQMTLENTRDAVVSLGQRGIGEATYFPWYGAKYSNLKVWGDVIPAGTGDQVSGTNCTTTVTVNAAQNGTCGTANGVASPTAPAANLCASGSPSQVLLDGSTWRWNCGSGSGAAQCSAPKPADQTGSCGSAQGGSFPSAPTANLCATGTASQVTLDGSTWRWNCGSGTGAAQCTATKPTTPGGTCGTANGVASPTAPAANLCAAGTASSVLLDGSTWKWSCTLGSVPTQCTAPKSTGSAFAVAPSSQTINVGQTPTAVTISGGTAPYTLTFAAGGTGLNPALASGATTITFASAASGTGTLTGTVKDATNATVTFQVTVQASPALQGLQSFVISSPCDGQKKIVGDVCILRATGTFQDGSTRDISGLVGWEGFDTIGTVNNSTLQITKRQPLPETVATITARTTDPNIAAANSITITVLETLPRIVSVFTVGNIGIAKGAEADLFVRVQNAENTTALQNIEVVLVEGTYLSPSAIPESAQRFTLVTAGVPADITPEEPLNYLLKIPVVIPVLSQLDEGPATFLVTIHTPSGNRVSAVAPIFIGVPPSGDADGNGRFELLDIFLMMKMVNGEVMPTPEQIGRVDFDRNARVTIVDVIRALQFLLHRSS